MMNAMVTYENGMLYLSFQRAADTGDANDLKFSENENDCYYFFFPVDGGRHSDTDFSKHENTPHFSDQKICIRKLHNCY